MSKLVFFGTSEFAVPTLEALNKKGYEIVVVTKPDVPVGRKQVLAPPPVKLSAQKLGLKVLQPVSLKNSEIQNLFKIQNSKFKVGVVAAYGKIVPIEIMDIFPKGILNIHPSLLPKYRGPSPIQYTLLNGDIETGVTIIKIDNQVDHGPILKRATFRPRRSENYEELEKELANLGAELLVKTLPDYLAGKIKPKPQDDSKATFTKIITKEDGKVDWNKTAKEIYNQFRAFHKWPGIWFRWQDKILKIIDCKIYEAEPKTHEVEPREPQKDGRLYVPCSKGYLELLKVQPEGGKVLSAKEFINGYGRFLEKV